MCLLQTPLRRTFRPTITGTIGGATTVDEGDTANYGVTASDLDGDTLTYLWSITGGNATISGPATGSSVNVSFSDGPSTVGLSVVVSDGHGGSDSESLSITENNVAPTVTLSGVLVANEGDTKSYSFTVTDPGDDAAATTTTQDCGAASTTDTLSGFDCTFPDNGNYTISAGADDHDPSNNVGSDRETVIVANVAPSIMNWLLTGGSGTACVGGNVVSLSFDVEDPADQAHDPIVGTAFQAFSTREVSQTKSFGAGPW